ncbi:MAG: hypothetical protein OXC40_07960, partial [Proteobacteria bacterium]|nr:hypothetical protein [Pseudomonadota bacterium]
MPLFDFALPILRVVGREKNLTLASELSYRRLPFQGWRNVGGYLFPVHGSTWRGVHSLGKKEFFYGA